MRKLPLAVFGLALLYASHASTGIRIVELVGVVLWIFLMVKAFQHEKFKLPVIAEITDALLRQG